MALADKAFSDLNYIEVLIGIIIAWILVAVWQRVIENISYNFFKLNPESAFHAFIVAITLTIIFITLIESVDSIARDILTGETDDSVSLLTPPGIPISER